MKLELNGKEVVPPTAPPTFGNAQFSIPYSPGNLTAIALSSSTVFGEKQHRVLATDTKITTGPAVAVRLTLDAPSPRTGTGSYLVADGEDTAMVRAELLDEHGVLADQADAEVTFAVLSGDGKIWATHNGDASSHEAPHGPRHKAYHGLARAFVRSSSDRATSIAHRRRLLEVDLDGGHSTKIHIESGTGLGAAADVAQVMLPSIVVKATVVGLPPATLKIPLTKDLRHLPLAVAGRPTEANAVEYQ